MIKLSYKDNEKTKIKTILPMKEFFIEGTDKQVTSKNFVTYEVSVDGDCAPSWLPLD